jgi:catechol 2,3-dioxygenase
MTFHQQPASFVNHIHLKVGNITRSLDFYQKIVGFRIIEQQYNMVRLSSGGMEAIVTLEQPEKAVSLNPEETGLFHIAFLLPTRSDLANMLRHLIHTGYPLHGASDHLVSEALYLSDPDGNGIEFYVDRDHNSWEWNKGSVNMATLPLDANHLMLDVNPDGWGGLPEKTIIGHIHLRVADLAAVEPFYIKGFGFSIVSRFGSQSLFLSTCGYHHHIGLNTWNSNGGAIPDAASIGLKSFTISVPSKERKKIQQRLKRLGFSVEKAGSQYRAQDPSGNVVLF